MDRKEFENIVLPLSRNLYRMAFRILSTAEDAEDAVQEVSIKLWGMRKKLANYRSIEALATTMTRNHCLDQLRRRGRQVSDDPGRERGISEEDIEKQMENRESYNRVLAIVDGLPQRYASWIRMRDIDELDYDEIVRATGDNINTIRVNLSRARKMVREKLKELYYEPATSR